ncbi:MAG: HEAT repeat domain-containing protein [Clostridia bacterium]|nr:HEAT repeat domain-containing protein [Clostridia bacterium]
MGKHTEKINKLAEKKKTGKIAGYLNDKDLETRIDAIRALGRCGGEEAINRLMTQMASHNPQERIEVAKALGECGPDAAFYQLSHYAAQETDAAVKEAMKEAMGKIHKRTNEKDV